MPSLETTTSAWVTLASALAAGTEPTDLAVGERTYLTVKAAIAAAASGDEKIVIHRIDSSIETRANAMRFRCVSTADAAACTFVLYIGTLNKAADCDLTYLGTLAFTTGLQQSTDSTYLFADQVTPTAGDTTVSWGSTSAADDRVAEAAIELQGADILIIVPTVVAADCKLFGKGY